jgi:isopentenyl diphosphate isomerase/L-lactate dehydrogenase-like FMN-dependent dehydrogenase
MQERTAGMDIREQYQVLHEFIPAAKRALTPDKWDYMIGAAETETTLKRNRLALDSIGFRPRVLRDVSSVDCSGKLFGRKSRIPVMLAPVGSIERFDAGGAATVARAAARFGVPQMVSSVCEPDLEETAAASAAQKFYQLYVRGDEAWVEAIMERAAQSGYEAFTFTLDTALYSRRERDIAKRAVMRSTSDLNAMVFQARLTWDKIKRFKKSCKLPLILKGIQTAEDALIACDHGVEAIHVTNHGGRQLDHGRGSIDILPEVVRAVRGRAQIIVDGGFCRGTDIVKGMARGADAVSIGRLYLYGMAAAGEAGIHRVLELLEDEIRICLGLLGVTKFAELDESCLHAAPPVVEPHQFSAFPLLGQIT